MRVVVGASPFHALGVLEPAGWSPLSFFPPFTIGVCLAPYFARGVSLSLLGVSAVGCVGVLSRVVQCGPGLVDEAHIAVRLDNVVKRCNVFGISNTSRIVCQKHAQSLLIHPSGNWTTSLGLQSSHTSRFSHTDTRYVDISVTSVVCTPS